MAVATTLYLKHRDIPTFRAAMQAEYGYAPSVAECKRARYIVNLPEWQHVPADAAQRIIETVKANRDA